LNDLQVFRNAEFGELTLLEINNAPWFVGKEVAEKLGYTNQNEAIQDHVSYEDKLNSKMLSSFDDYNFGQRGAWLINESGLYSLILGSKLESAKRFKHWVTSEVLPAIRRTGSYSNQPTGGKLLAMAVLEAQKLLEAKDEEIARMKPKEIFADSVAGSKHSILIGELAKILTSNGFKTGQNRLFVILRDDGFLIKRKGTDFNMPSQKSMELGLMEIKETAINNPDGSIRLNKTTKVTGKGQIYFVNRYCGNIERM
jgi:hypothetical protein